LHKGAIAFPTFIHHNFCRFPKLAALVQAAGYLVEVVALSLQLGQRRRNFLDNNYRFVAQHFQKKVGLVFTLRRRHSLQVEAVFFISHAQGYGFAACAILHCFILPFDMVLTFAGFGACPNEGALGLPDAYLAMLSQTRIAMGREGCLVMVLCKCRQPHCHLNFTPKRGTI